MPQAQFRYQLGDLVKFGDKRLTEGYIDDVTRMGIVIAQRYVFTADNRFLVGTPSGNHWVRADRLSLVSRAENKT